jgi:hypothetical protein
MEKLEESQVESQEESLEGTPEGAQDLSQRATKLLEEIGNSGTHTQRAEAISIAQAWATLASVTELRAISEKFTTFETTMMELVKELD